MHFLNEMICPQCVRNFPTASELLQHFASHALEDGMTDVDTEVDAENYHYIKKIPDLHPIETKINDKSIEENMNPLVFCEVSLKDGKLKKTEKKEIPSKTFRSYKCSYCLKIFGWSTDLKRHILSHTGEKPFRCSLCNISYTRKSILHKHMEKFHKKPKIPDLKPINSGFRLKAKKN